MKKMNITNISLGLAIIGGVSIAANRLSKTRFLSQNAEKAIIAGTGLALMVSLLSGMKRSVPEI